MTRTLVLSLIVIAVLVLAVGGWVVGGARRILRPAPRLRVRPAI
jgi:hypothetical protein